MNTSPQVRVSTWLRTLVASAATFAFAMIASAQSSDSSVVTGIVTNQATGDILAGATVQVDGSDQRTATDRDGIYRLTVTAGEHTLAVGFSGLDTARITFTATAGQPVKRDVQLTSAVYTLEKFSVTSVREGNAKAIQTQRLAPNPKIVASTDTFGNPASNPGELIQRLPGISTDIVGSEVRSLFIRGMGPGFSSLLIDGNRVASSSGTTASRDYQIEQLGTGNVQTVELIKAPTPDQDANSVAGFVNLVTRRGFDLPSRRITLTAGTLWRERGFSGSPLVDRADSADLLSLSYADAFSVFGGHRNLGIAFNLSRRVSATTQDEMGPVLSNIAQTYLNPNSATPLQRLFGVGDFGYPAKAHNAGLNVDYKLGDDAFVYVRLAFNSNYQFQEFYRPTVGNATATAANFSADSTYEHTVLLPHAASVAVSESSDFTKKSTNYSLNTGGETKVFNGAGKLSVRAGFSRANIYYPGYTRVQSRTTGAGIGYTIDRAGRDAWYPAFTQTAGPSVYDPASYNLSSLSRQVYEAPNDIYGLRADYEQTFATRFPLTFKTGAKYDEDKREQLTDYTESTWVGADGVPGTADDVMTPYATLSYAQGDGRYGPFPFVALPGSGRAGDPLQAPGNYWRQTAANAYNSYATSNASDADFKETIAAAYVQGSVQFGPVRVLGGVRFEETRTEGTAWVRNTTASWGGNSVGGASLDPATAAANALRAQRSFVRRNQSSGRYRDFFPGMHVVYEPLDGLLFRGSYNRAISRPNVALLLPTVTENSETNSISIGNPDLKPYHTDNFDLSVEKYFEPVGLFSAGVFVKKITDYTRSFSSTVGAEGIDGNGLYSGYTLTTTLNVGSAEIRGFELGYQQQFSFLPGALKGLGAFANYTYLEAEGDFGGTTTTTQLANLSPRSGNAGLNFRHRGFDARLLANWTAEKYIATTSGVDTYNEERLMFDLKLQYSVNRSVDLFLDATNLTDEPTRAYVTLNGLNYFKANQGLGFTAGIRARF